jgi:hypothetical protein
MTHLLGLLAFVTRFQRVILDHMESISQLANDAPILLIYEYDLSAAERTVTAFGVSLAWLVVCWVVGGQVFTGSAF